MKKNGFTLIEIIISIAILSLIATIGIVTIKKVKEKNLEEKKVEYVERIRLETEVYRKTQRNDKRLNLLNDPGDYIYIQIKDLIAVGLLKEEEENPYHETNNKEVDYDLIKIYLDDELNIQITYPTIYVNIGKDDIEKLKNNVFIHLKENNYDNNKVILPTTETILNKIKELNSTQQSAFNALTSTFATIKSKGYTYNGNMLYEFNEPGYYLADFYGEEIPTVESDWCINKNWETNGWTYTYTICENSDLRKLYNNIEDEENKRTISAIDNSAPMIVDISNNNYSEYDGDYLYCYYSTNSEECNYKKYEEKKGNGASNYYKYYIFDNYDIINEDKQFQEIFKLKTWQREIIKDNSGNSKIYSILKQTTKNNVPIITYTYNGYYLKSNLSYSKRGENYYLSQIINNIKIKDDIDTSNSEYAVTEYDDIKNDKVIGKNNISIEIKLKYVYNDLLESLNRDTVSDISIYNRENKKFPVYGRYTLYVKVCDTFGECTEEDNFSVAIRDYVDQLIHTGAATGCNDICIIEIMQANSIIWRDNENKRDEMRDLNIDYKSKLTNANNIYERSGSWCERSSTSSTTLLYNKVGQTITKEDYKNCVIGQMETNGRNYENNEHNTLSAANITLANSLINEGFDIYYIQAPEGRVWCERTNINDVTRLLDYDIIHTTSNPNNKYKDYCILVQMKINGSNYVTNGDKSNNDLLVAANETLATKLSYDVEKRGGTWYKKETDIEILYNINQENDGIWYISK